MREGEINRSGVFVCVNQGATRTSFIATLSLVYFFFLSFDLNNNNNHNNNTNNNTNNNNISNIKGKVTRCRIHRPKPETRFKSLISYETFHK